jgi:DNA-binding ferritin-like protein (Dps family)
MNWDEVLKAIEEGKDSEEVKKFLTAMLDKYGKKELTGDEVNAFLDTEDGKKLIQPRIDTVVTKALQTRDKSWEEKNKDAIEKEVKKRVADEVLKMNPQEEPWQKEMRELKEKMDQKDKDYARSELKRQITEEAAKMGIDPFFLEDYIPETIEAGKLYLKRISDHNKKVKEAVVNELVASGQYKPNGEKRKDDNKIDLGKLSVEEATKLELEGKLDENFD